MDIMRMVMDIEDMERPTRSLNEGLVMFVMIGVGVPLIVHLLSTTGISKWLHANDWQTLLEAWWAVARWAGR